MTDHFTVFGLARKLQLDPEELRQRFYALSRQHHPDFHQMATPEAQAAALARSAAVNRGYRALRDPLSRVEYLIALEEGRETREGAEIKPKAPRDLLEEMLEIQEALEEAKTAGLDDESKERLRGERRRLTDRQAAEQAAIIARFPEWDRAIDAGADTTALREWFKQALATRAYLRTVIDDLGGALGEHEEEHVSHRRH